MKTSLFSLAQRPAPIRLGCFILTLLLPWLPYAAAVYIMVKDENTRTIFAMGILAIEFLFLLPWWSKYIHDSTPAFPRYGSEFTRKNGVELPRGIALGQIIVFLLFFFFILKNKNFYRCWGFFLINNKQKKKKQINDRKDIKKKKIKKKKKNNKKIKILKY